MLSLNINNPTVENFYKQECHGDNDTFVSNLLHYIETYNIKKSFTKGLNEVEMIQKGVLKKQELKQIIDEL